jgi:hypothetical protein
LRGILCVQCAVRMWLARRVVRNVRQQRAVLGLQRLVRGWLARCRVGVLYCAIVRLQCFVRTVRARSVVRTLRRTRSATSIATFYRRYAGQSLRMIQASYFVFHPHSPRCCAGGNHNETPSVSVARCCPCRGVAESDKPSEC